MHCEVAGALINVLLVMYFMTLLNQLLSNVTTNVCMFIANGVADYLIHLQRYTISIATNVTIHCDV